MAGEATGTGDTPGWNVGVERGMEAVPACLRASADENGSVFGENAKDCFPRNSPKLRVLITGYTPWAGFDYNISMEILKRWMRDHGEEFSKQPGHHWEVAQSTIVSDFDDYIEVTAVIIDTDQQGLFEFFQSEVNNRQYDFVISLGLRGIRESEESGMEPKFHYGKWHIETQVLDPYARCPEIIFGKESVSGQDIRKHFFGKTSQESVGTGESDWNKKDPSSIAPQIDTHTSMKNLNAKLELVDPVLCNTMLESPKLDLATNDDPGSFLCGQMFYHQLCRRGNGPSKQTSNADSASSDGNKVVASRSTTRTDGSHAVAAECHDLQFRCPPVVCLQDGRKALFFHICALGNPTDACLVDDGNRKLDSIIHALPAD